MATLKERVDKHGREIAAIRKLVLQGMRLLSDQQRMSVEMRKELKALAVAQKRTEETLQAFIQSMKRGGNGHAKNVSLQ